NLPKINAVGCSKFNRGDSYSGNGRTRSAQQISRIVRYQRRVQDRHQAGGREEYHFDHVQVNARDNRPKNKTPPRRGFIQESGSTQPVATGGTTLAAPGGRYAILMSSAACLPRSLITL